MNRIEKLFKDKAIFKGGIVLFNKENALSFIIECEKNGNAILGIDAFYLLEETIQPSLENSIDFSSPEYQQEVENIYSEAINFLQSKTEKMFFEIVCVV